MLKMTRAMISISVRVMAAMVLRVMMMILIVMITIMMMIIMREMMRTIEMMMLTRCCSKDMLMSETIAMLKTIITMTMTCVMK